MAYGRIQEALAKTAVRVARVVHPEISVPGRSADLRRTDGRPVDSDFTGEDGAARFAGTPALGGQLADS